MEWSVVESCCGGQGQVREISRGRAADSENRNDGDKGVGDNAKGIAAAAVRRPQTRLTERSRSKSELAGWYGIRKGEDSIQPGEIVA
ncbi:hypothetical protein CPLU01_15441 [Colletotrichum plurivorum]|uniref:Uncharacterized protein n=1 Tax=Colletotrichum plurivorum TaxID=2175906 RepID=A0A8H6JB33_9PEZI|nr:hypothetical protein CPLU01_15441 [Colletotrichum plurivorum]